MYSLPCDLFSTSKNKIYSSITLQKYNFDPPLTPALISRLRLHWIMQFLALIHQKFMHTTVLCKEFKKYYIYFIKFCVSFVSSGLLYRKHPRFTCTTAYICTCTCIISGTYRHRPGLQVEPTFLSSFHLSIFSE